MFSIDFQIKGQIKLLVIVQMKSAHYFETLLLESWQTWYSNTRTELMTPNHVQITRSKVKVKLHVFKKYCPLNISWTVAGKKATLGTVNVSRE